MVGEIKMLATTKSKHVVNYLISWIDDVVEVDASSSSTLTKNKYLFIQTEYYPFNLKEIIDIKRKFFENKSTKSFKIIDYFISYNLFEEILECVHYLHQRNIIHRDLKPANILVAEEEKDGKFVRLCDFGLSIYHNHQDQSHTKGQGTFAYMAPEVKNGSQYSTKADIFTLSLVACEIIELKSW